MAKKVLFTADDYGLTKGVTDGILHCHDKGLVTNTSLMVNMPDALRAVELSKSRPNLSIGLHLNLTQGRPLSKPEDIPSLVDKDGFFRKLSLTHPRKARSEHVRIEVCAQIEHFKSLGFGKFHIDGHHYVTFIPTVLNVLLDVSQKYGIDSMRMIDTGMINRGVKRKIIGFSLLCLGSKAVFGLKRHVIRWRKLIDSKNILIPDSLVSWELYGDADPVSSLYKTFDRLPEGTTEIFCHPGFVDDELRAISTYTDIRDKELHAFTDPDIIKAFENSGAELANAWNFGGAA
jgi:predicted glycoside hydrolase/deacetylase ChbG (UPF0249 family)